MHDVNVYSSIWWMNKLPLENATSKWAYHRQTKLNGQRVGDVKKEKSNPEIETQSETKRFDVIITKASTPASKLSKVAATTSTILWSNYWLNILELLFDAYK